MMLDVKEEKEDSCRQNIQQSKWCMRDQICADKEVQDDWDNAACSQHTSSLPLANSEFWGEEWGTFCYFQEKTSATLMNCKEEIIEVTD